MLFLILLHCIITINAFFLYCCSGAIRFFTEPPASQEAAVEATTLVTSLSKVFSLDDFVSNNDSQEMEQDHATNETISEPHEDVQSQEMETEEEQPMRRITRSAAKKSVSFAIDEGATSLLQDRKTSKKQRQSDVTISPEGQKKLGLVASKKTIMKKLRKSKKKSAKHASALSDLVGTLSM